MPAEKLKEISVKDEKDWIKQSDDEIKEADTALDQITKDGLDDLEMIEGKHQWDAAIEKWRTEQKPPRPCITQNLLPAFIDQVVNEQRKSRPDVKVVPTDDMANPKTAQIIAGIIRNIHYKSQADPIRDQSFDSSVMCSLGAWQVTAEYERAMSNNQVLRIRPISNPLALRWDMGCELFDTSDKKYCYTFQTLRKKDFETKYPKATSAISTLDAQGAQMAGWFMEDEVKVVQRWYVEEKEISIIELPNGTVIEKPDEEEIKRIMATYGLVSDRALRERKTKIPKVRSAIRSGMEILEGPFDWKGEYIPVMISFGKVMDINGVRKIKSLIRDAKETQRIHNYLITTMIESYSMQPNVPYIGTQKMFENHPEWDTANEGGYSKLTYTPDPSAPGGSPKREAPPAISNQLFPMIQGNEQTMRNIIGIQKAGLGMESNETSGIAIQRRKAEGDTGSYAYMSNFLFALQFEGRVLADLIPYYYDTPRDVMTTSADGTHTLMPINKQTPNGYNDITKGRYECIITTGPAFTTQRDETLTTLNNLIQAVGQTVPGIAAAIVPDLVKLVNVPNVEQLVNRIISVLPPQIQQAIMAERTADGSNPEVQQMKQQFEQQMEMTAQEMQKMTAVLQDLQGKLAQAEQQLADKRDEMMFKRAIEGRKMDIEERKLQAETPETIKLQTEINDLKGLVESLDRALEVLIGHSMKKEGEKQEKVVQPNIPVSNPVPQQPIVIVDGQLIQPSLSEPEEDKKKVISIIGPSGKVYTGTIETVEESKKEKNNVEQNTDMGS
jgi:hypothetical protein